MKPEDMTFFYQPPDRLRLTVKDDRSYVTVKPVWSAPLSRPNTYLALLDGKNKEIALLPHPQSLESKSWEALQQELHERYLTATVTAVSEGRQEFGATYWSVETDRGPRDFVTQNLQETALWLSETHLLLLDVDGNRFEIPDTTALDERSLALLHGIL